MVDISAVLTIVRDVSTATEALTPYEQASLLIQGLGFSGIILSIWVARSIAKADHDRRRMQATIDYLHGLRPRWVVCLATLDGHFNNETQLSSEQAKEITESADLDRTAREMLFLIEHLAVGANADVYDSEIIYCACGFYLINVHVMMGSYITLMRKKWDNDTLYEEFSKLARKFEDKRREKRPQAPAGDTRVRQV